jgi:hypothetical protein
MAGGRASDNQLARRFGRVVDAAGLPVPHAQVVIAAAAVPMPEIALLSDEAGRFSVRLPPGTCVLRAHGPPGTGQAEVGQDPADQEIVITISR